MSEIVIDRTAFDPLGQNGQPRVHQLGFTPPHRLVFVEQHKRQQREIGRAKKLLVQFKERQHRERRRR